MEYKKLGDTCREISVIGQGTGIGGNFAVDAQYGEKHVNALKLGIDLGMTFIDTAAAYGRGAAEETVAKAVKGIRDKVFIATKFSPENNSYDEILKSAEKSLLRLQTDYIDLYQVHWLNPAVPIEETMAAMKRLRSQKKIRHIGICNFSLNDFKKAQLVLGDERIVSIQVEYNLFDRSVERDILSYCEENNITTIAYSPLDQGRIASSKKNTQTLAAIAEKYGKTPAQIALNWLAGQKTVIAIPNAFSEKHILENSRCFDFHLEKTDFEKISAAFSQGFIYIPPERIRAFYDCDKSPFVYKTIEEAVMNKKGFIPAPLDLARHIQEGAEIKPIRVKRSDDKSGRYDFDLLEGRVRYWAWMIAYKGIKPMPALVRDN